MKRVFLLAISLFVFSAAFSFAQEFQYTDATTLSIVGKVFPDVPHPYRRMDFERFGGFTNKDKRRLNNSSGIAVTFVTDSPVISVKPVLSNPRNDNNPPRSTRGFDLYIKKDGKWLWAGVQAAPAEAYKEENLVLVKNMEPGVSRECLLYLPLYSDVESVHIGTVQGSSIAPGGEPFRHRIVLGGSSYMHGATTSRSGMTVPAILTRMTGLQFLSLGMSGDFILQEPVAKALAEADAEAFVFDAFSNPTDEEINERLFRFIETVRAGHPGKPIIIMSSIYRERRNFDTVTDRDEQAKMDMADSLMKIAVKKYPDLYYIHSNATDKMHDTSGDGTHPADYGYVIWAESIRKPIVKILRKYGIK